MLPRDVRAMTPSEVAAALGLDQYERKLDRYRREVKAVPYEDRPPPPPPPPDSVMRSRAQQRAAARTR